MNIQPYLKTVSAVVTVLIGWVTAVVNSPSGPITSTEWIVLATCLVTALGVFTVPNAAKTTDTAVAPPQPPAAPVGPVNP